MGKFALYTIGFALLACVPAILLAGMFSGGGGDVAPFLLGLLAVGEAFLSLFTNSPEVIAAGMLRMRIMCWSYCLSAFMDCTIAASRGLGKTVVPTIIVILGSCVFRVIWVYTIFAHFHTIPALYLLYPCSWTLTAFAEILYFVHCYKQSMALFKEPQAA